MALRPEVRWLWNGELAPDVLRRQLSAIRERGFRGVVVWPWAGLEVPFASPAYAGRLPDVCELAEQLDLALWLADDVNWPSGTAGGRLVSEHPEFAQRALVCTSRWIPRIGAHQISWRGEGEQLILALALDTGGARRELARQMETRGRPVQEQRAARFAGHAVPWEAEQWESELALPPGEWFVTIATVVRTQPLLPAALGTRWSSGLPGTLDVLNPEAVRAFMRLTVESFAPARRWFGSTVQGIVTRPPGALLAHAITPSPGWRADVFPWFDELPQRYEQRTGQPLTKQLPYLLAPLHHSSDEPEEVPAPADKDKPQQTISALAGERYRECYWEQLSRWCRGEGLHLLAVSPESLPALPYTLKAERKVSLPMSQVLSVEIEPGDGGGTASGAPVPQRGWSLLHRSPLSPSVLGEHRGEAHEWTPIDAFLPRWHWRHQSLNVHPLEDWAWHRLPRRDDLFRVRATFEADYVPDGLCLVFEAGAVEGASLNGVSLDLSDARPPLPEEIQLADTCARLVLLRGAAPGENTLDATIRLPPGERIAFLDPPPAAVLGPFFVAGRFAVLSGRSAGSGREREIMVRPVGDAPPGDWRLLGYPRYAGTAVYRQSVVVPSLPAHAAVRLLVTAFDGTASVEVDNRPQGLPQHAPCVFDLTGTLRPGASALAIAITNSLGTRITGEGGAGLESATLEYRATPG